MMKRLAIIILALAMALSLAACAGKGDANTDAASGVKQDTHALEQALANVVPDVQENTEKAADAGEFDLDNVEIDITEMNSTMVYSQVYDMLVSPDDYLGKTVKMTGTFAVYESPERNYYACVIADATACCSQGIEFVLEGDLSYPEDYPALGDDITVVGVFDSYYEGQSRYAQLIHAEMR